MEKMIENFSITIVMENGENCFQTHEEKQENNWVIPVGIEQSFFYVFLSLSLYHIITVLIRGLASWKLNAHF